MQIKNLLENVWQGWHKWSQDELTRRLFSGMCSVASLTFLVKLTALARELIVADKFGTGVVIDAYLMAMLIPIFCVQILAGSVGAALTPIYIEQRERVSTESARKLAQNIVFIALLLLLLTALLVVVCSPWILAILCSGFSIDTLNLTKSLLLYLLPVLILSGLSNIFSSILNASERFALVALTPIVMPATGIVFLLLFAREWGVFALALGTSIGVLIEFSILAWAIYRSGLLGWPRWHGYSEPLADVVQQYIPMFVGAFLMSGAAVVDQGMAAMLDPGSVAAYSYGTRLVSVMVGIVALAVGTAIFPHFSVLIARNEWVSVGKTFSAWVKFLLAALVPLTLILVFASDYLVHILYERGSFTSSDSILVSKIQICYALQIPFYVLNILGIRLLAAAKKNLLLLLLSTFNLLINVLGNYILMQFLGVSGIALSTSVLYLISFSLVAWQVAKLCRQKVESLAGA